MFFCFDEHHIDLIGYSGCYDIAFYGFHRVVVKQYESRRTD